LKFFYSEFPFSRLRAEALRRTSNDALLVTLTFPVIPAEAGIQGKPMKIRWCHAELDSSPRFFLFSEILQQVQDNRSGNFQIFVLKI
jgi:hypothetical protein